MASIWTGAIGFGLVNIPVKMVSAVRPHDLGFRLLHQPKSGKKDLCPIGYEKVCKRNGKEVPSDEIVKGYEYEKDKFVILTEEDFEQAAQATTKEFRIQNFVPSEQVDARFFEKPYYLIPTSGAPGAEKAYALLREAMGKTGTLGVGTITLRKKQYLASIKPLDDKIVLDLMRFDDEVLDAAEYRFPDEQDFHPKELEMAEQLIDNLCEDFQPAQYKDEYKANLEKIIGAKMKGKTVSLKEAAEPDMSGVIDLQARLAESLKTTKGGGKSGTKTKKSTPASRRKKSAA